MERTRKHFRIKSKVRFIIFITIITLSIFTVFNMTMGADRANGETARKYITVEIAAGDTLWDIADEYMSDTDSDMRHAVYTLQQVNDLDSANVNVGQEIKVPIS